MSPDELRALMDGRDRTNLYVVDVRTTEEFAAGHIAGAIWVPGGQAVQATDDAVAVRAAVIVLACDGFTRSVMTASWLKRMGYPRVSVLAGGLAAWADSGGATETGHPVAVPFGYESARARVTHLAAPALDRVRGDAGAPAIVSVDQSDVYARGHVPGAGWLCRSRLELAIAGVVADKSRPIVMTCADGVASTLATATLVQLGYERASVLEGGTRAWEAGGLAVERGRTRLLDDADDITLKPYERGREAMETYLEWEEALDPDGVSPVQLIRDGGTLGVERGRSA